MKTTTRASRKAGKKSTSAQSAIVPKIAPGQPVEISPENPAFAGLPPKLIEEAQVSVSINLGPLSETRGNTYKGKLEIGGGIYEAIGRHLVRSGHPDFSTAFSDALREGLRRSECKENIRESLDSADDTVAELKLIFHMLRATMNNWCQEGVPTKEILWDLNCGFLALANRIESALTENIEALRKRI